MATKGFVIAGLAGGSGKSVVTVGVTAAFARRGSTIVPFKKGPDYIDAGWLSLAAAHRCYNLDPYLVPQPAIIDSFYRHSAGADIAIVEGNRGLYDGVNAEGGYSTADLSILLNLPVILVVDCTKTTRTVAALVLGCKLFDQRLQLKGVILNQVATERQRKLITEAVLHYTGIPVIGAMPRLHRDIFPMRHLGMIPHQEYAGSNEALGYLADLAEAHIDFSELVTIMSPIPNGGCENKHIASTVPQVTIGVLRDAAFQFYYSENIEALERAGAAIVYLDAMHDKNLPAIDGLYIGGGFPETGARYLAANREFRKAIRDAADRGLPIYAECGGLMYLGTSIEVAGETYPLVDVFPVHFGMHEKPQAHGYSIFHVEKENAFYSVGDQVKGHEFRYSKILQWSGSGEQLALKMARGTGFMHGRDGLVYKNVLALYTHVHADGTPNWAKGFVETCLRNKSSLPVSS